MAFTEDLTPFFFTTDFAVTGMLAGSHVTGIIDTPYLEALGEVEGRQPVFFLPTASAPSVAHGQELVIGAKTYKVRGVEPDGTGVTLLRLEEQ